MIRIPVRRALLSVYDKTGLVEFAKRLVAADVEVVSSGGTAGAAATMSASAGSSSCSRAGSASASTQGTATPSSRRTRRF